MPINPSTLEAEAGVSRVQGLDYTARPPSQRKEKEKHVLLSVIVTLL
jgi:hypothetical protein